MRKYKCNKNMHRCKNHIAYSTNENHDKIDWFETDFASCCFGASKCSVPTNPIQLNTQSYLDTESRCNKIIREKHLSQSSIITLDNCLDEMKKANTYSHEIDEEEGHKRADDILCSILRSLGYNDLVDIYDDVSKWYS